MKQNDGHGGAEASGAKLVKTPVRINEETLEEFKGLHPDITVERTRIGGEWYPCAVHWLPEGAADAFLLEQEREARREQREARCLLPDGTGGFLRCPEQNRCWECERAGRFDFDDLRPVSLDALRRAYEEAEAQDGADGRPEAGGPGKTWYFERADW